MDDLDFDFDASAAVDRMKVGEPVGTERECVKCGVIFRAKRSTAKYCSHACRQAAYADRPAADPNRVCLTCGSPIGHKRADAMHCDDWCRSRYNAHLSAAAVDYFMERLGVDGFDKFQSVTQDRFDTTPVHAFKAGVVKDAAPELASAVAAGDLSLHRAFHMVMRADEAVTE